jgi:hypothetical protein
LAEDQALQSARENYYEKLQKTRDIEDKTVPIIETMQDNKHRMTHFAEDNLNLVAMVNRHLDQRLMRAKQVGLFQKSNTVQVTEEDDDCDETVKISQKR